MKETSRPHRRCRKLDPRMQGKARSYDNGAQENRHIHTYMRRQILPGRSIRYACICTCITSKNACDLCSFRDSCKHQWACFWRRGVGVVTSANFMLCTSSCGGQSYSCCRNRSAAVVPFVLCCCRLTQRVPHNDVVTSTMDVGVNSRIGSNRCLSQLVCPQSFLASRHADSM